VSGSTDPNAIKTLVVTGLPKDLTKNVLWKKVRKIGNDIELVYPVEGEQDTGESETQ
jgi:nucleolar protein 4